jgi:hypothetical protein
MGAGSFSHSSFGFLFLPVFSARFLNFFFADPEAQKSTQHTLCWGLSASEERNLDGWGVGIVGS